MAWPVSVRFGVSLILFVFALFLWSRRAVGQTTTQTNDAFANRTVLSGMTNFVRASNVGATRENGEPQHAGTTGGSSVWWNWTAPTSGTFMVSTEGSTFDTLLAIYIGTSLSNLAVVAANDDTPSNTASAVFFRAIADETYQIAVDGFQGDTGNITLRLGTSGYAQPAWSFPDFRSTNRISFAAFRNKVVLLDFWETRCEACTNENRDLLQLRETHRAQGFEIVGVSKDQSMADVYYGIRDLGITYPVLINDPSVEAEFGEGFIFVPTKFLIDREGKIQMKIEGGNTVEYYAALIEPLLRGSARIDLDIKAEPGEVILSWAGNEFGWVVEGASRAAGSPWMQLTSTIATTNSEGTVILPAASETNDEHFVTFAATNEAKFFRLRKP